METLELDKTENDSVTSLTTEQIQEIFTKAAWSAKSSGWPIDVDDLIQELWIWYLDRFPKNQTLDKQKATNMAQNLAAAEKRKDMLFNVTYDYSVDTVKGILKGKIRGRQSVEDLTDALERLGEQVPDHVEIIRKRYFGENPGDGGTTDLTDAEVQRLVRAHVRLTDEMNKVRREARMERDGLGDGLGRPEPQPQELGISDYEEKPNQGYWDRRFPE